MMGVHARNLEIVARHEDVVAVRRRTDGGIVLIVPVELDVLDGAVVVTDVHRVLPFVIRGRIVGNLDDGAPPLSCDARVVDRGVEDVPIRLRSVIS